MNVALWVVQGLLALAFLAAGGMKVFAYEKYDAMPGLQGAAKAKRTPGFSHLNQ